MRREAWVRVPPEVQLFFFEKKAVSGFVLCCVALSFFLLLRSVLSIYSIIHVSPQTSATY